MSPGQTIILVLSLAVLVLAFWVVGVWVFDLYTSWRDSER